MMKIGVYKLIGTIDRHEKTAAQDSPSETKAFVQELLPANNKVY